MKKIILFLVPFIVTVLLWTLNYFDGGTITYFISAAIWTIAIVTLIFTNVDSKYVLYLIVLVPFTYARRFEITTIPIHLIIGIIVVILAMIIKFIIIKPKIKFSKVLLSTSIFCFALLLGGIFTPFFSFKNFLIILLIALSILFILVYFTSTKININFEEFSNYFIGLGMMICTMVVIRMIDTKIIFDKNIQIGWASNSNNIALILSFVLPLICYKLLKKKLLFNIPLTIVGCIILATYSRGVIFVVFLFFVLTPIFVTFTKKWNKQLIISYGIQFLFLLSFLVIERNRSFELIVKIIDIHFDSLNGRLGIYKENMALFNSYPLFGAGFFNNTERETFLFAHSTFIQTLSSLGVMGLFALCFHYLTIYKIDLKLDENKALLCCLLLPELYGMLDVSLYYVVYLIILLFVLVYITITPTVLLTKTIEPKQIKTHNKYVK